MTTTRQQWLLLTVCLFYTCLHGLSAQDMDMPGHMNHDPSTVNNSVPMDMSGNNSMSHGGHNNSIGDMDDTGSHTENHNMTNMGNNGGHPNMNHGNMNNNEEDTTDHGNHDNTGSHGNTRDDGNHDNMGDNDTMADHGNHGNMGNNNNVGDHGNHGNMGNDDNMGDHGNTGHGNTGDAGDGGSHGSHGNSGSVGHGLYFYAGVDAIILFEEWVTDSTLKLAGACVAVGVAAMLYEGFKVLREKLLYRATSKKYSNQCHLCDCLHILQSFLHVLQVAISYTLMLVFMTFNVWLCLALCVGAGFGYWLFHSKRHAIRMADINEHCN